jgi:hypothetical protein
VLQQAVNRSNSFQGNFPEALQIFIFHVVRSDLEYTKNALPHIHFHESREESLITLQSFKEHVVPVESTDNPQFPTRLRGIILTRNFFQ